MSSPAAGPNSIRIPVVVDFDQATGQMKSFRRVAAVEAGGAAKEMGVALTGAEAQTAKAAVGMTDSLGKLRPLMGTITRGLGAMGIEGAGAFSGLTRGAITLLNTGFTPLGLAVAAVTTGIGVLVARHAEAEKAAEDHRASLVRLKAELRSMQNETAIMRGGSTLARDLGSLPGDLQSKRAEMSRTGAQPFNGMWLLPPGTDVAEFTRLRHEEAQIIEQIAEKTKQLALANSLLVSSMQDAASWTRAQRLSLDEVDAAILKNHADFEKFRSAHRDLTEEQKLAVDALESERDAMIRLDATSASMTKRHKEEESAAAALNDELALLTQTSEEVRVKREAFLAAEKARADFLNSPVDQFTVTGPRNAGYSTPEERASEAAAREAVTQAIAEQHAEAQKRAAQMAARDAETFRSFGEAGAASITSALNRSITSGDFKDFFAQFQSGMQEAVISAFTYALIQKPLANALGDVTQGIGGLFGYGRAAGGSGGGGPAQSGTMETYMANGGVAKSAQVVNLHVSDGATLNIGGSKPGGVQRGKGARFAS